MKDKCLRCQGEIVRLEQESPEIKTYVCTECGLLETRISPEIIKPMVDKIKKQEKADD